jgi:hypothetical protein
VEGQASIHDAGIDRLVVPLPSEARERILPLLDHHARLLR